MGHDSRTRLTETCGPRDESPSPNLVRVKQGQAIHFGSSFSCSSPLWVTCLFVVPEGAMRTEGRDGARWPWLLSRPDRALLCPHGRVDRAMVTSTKSVNHDLWRFLLGVLRTEMEDWHRYLQRCANIFLSLGRLCGREWRGQHRGV